MREALAALARAAETMGEDGPATTRSRGSAPPTRPTAAAVDAARDRRRRRPVAVCAACRDQAAAGQPLAVRMIPHEGRPVPYRDRDDGPGRADEGGPTTSRG